MLLAIDIGNSTVSYGCFSKSDLRASWRIPTALMKTGSENGAMLMGQLQKYGLAPNQIHGVALCSVVPQLTSRIEHLAIDVFRISPLVATTDLDAGLMLRYADPRELGVDRFVAAARAYALYRSDVVVVDFGTATTFSVVDDQGTYLGGAIAPGVGISADALADKTAQLPRVDLSVPPSALGRNTISGIQSGVVFGQVALVEGMLDRFGRELGKSPKVVGTGGFATLIAPLSDRIHEVRPHLTLEGLTWLYQRLRPE